MPNPERWHPKMESAVLHKENWRKSAEWFAITRDHAQLAADDVAVDLLFQQYCAGMDVEDEDGS